MKSVRSVRMHAAVLVPATLAIASSAGPGCVANDLRSMREAEAAYEECVEQKSESHPDCEAKRVSYLEAQRRYEAISRTAWGCDPAVEECPTPR